MKDEDKIIYYRPELAKEMEKIMNNTINLYEQNQLGILYMFLEKAERLQGKEEEANLLQAASKCVLQGKIFWYETFERDYREDLNKLEYSLGDITEASAARITFEIVQEMVLKDKEALDLEPLTKMEKYMVDHFFNVLLAPTRNPNIQIHEGHNKCYYDEHRDAFFSSDIKRSIEYIKKDCGNTLDIFNCPDEELDKDDDKEM